MAGMEPLAAVGTLELPDGSVVQHSVFIVAYFDTEGQERYGFSTDGETSISATLGVIELAKGHMLASVFGDK